MEARAVQRHVRQSARKMRLVVDLIRGRPVPEAYAILRFSKKHAAIQIRKVLTSAVANAKQAADRQNERLDEDRLRVEYAVVNEGPTLKRFTMAAMGRGTPIKKRTSHVEIRVAGTAAPAEQPAGRAAAAKAETAAPPPKAKAKAPKKTKAAAGTVLRPARFPRAPQGRRPDPQVPEGAALARGDRRSAHRAQAGQGDGDGPHGAAGSGDRQAWRGGRQAARRAGAAQV